MSHFSLEEWADFTRGVVSVEKRELMQRHINEGCTRCLKACQTWKEIQGMLRSDDLYAPPDHAVRFAQGNFASQVSKVVRENWRLAELVFDGFSQAIPVGVRAVTAPGRQFLYKVDNIHVDMRIEPATTTGNLSLMGQVLEANANENALAGVTVILMSHEETVSTTTTDEFGQFQFEFGEQQDLRVLIQFQGKSPVMVFLGNPAGPLHG
jgi:hypothetical protein